jgi:hypothetical protein
MYDNVTFLANIMTQDNSQSSNRLHDTLRKCCIAVARLKLKDTVETEDAREVIEFYDKQLKYWSQIDTNIPPDPRDLAYQEMVKKLTGQKFKSEFIELLRAVCKDNVSVDQYTKKIDKETGERVWDIKNNKHVRYIHDKFTQGPRDERILILGTSPLTLAWNETYQGGDKDTVIDNNSGSEGTKSVTDHSDQTDHGKRYNDEENGPRTDQLASSIQLQDENSNGQTGHNGQLGNRDFGGSNNIISDNGIHKTVDNSLEDYETYVARQAEKVRTIKKEKAWRIFDELALNNAEENPGTKEVLEPRFREALISIGYSDADIDVIIKDMEKYGLARKVTELDGAFCDILSKGD